MKKRRRAHNSGSYVTKEEAVIFYQAECKRQGTTSFEKLDKTDWPTNIPKSPRSKGVRNNNPSYNGFKWSVDVNGKVSWVTMEEAIKFYTSEYKRLCRIPKSSDKTDWPTNIPLHPRSVYEKEGFSWDLIPGFNKRWTLSWITMEEAIEFYKSECKRQGIFSFYDIDKTGWADDIPKAPQEAYKDLNFKWSMVSGNIQNQVTGEISRKEIARLVMSFIDIIDTLDDMLIALLLSKLDGKNLSKLITRKVRKLVTDIVEDNEPGERKEALEELNEKILNNDLGETDDENLEAASEEDETDDDETDATNEESGSDVDYEEKLKKKIKVMEKAMLNNDIDIDYKNLLKTNAIKSMWYLAVRK